MKIFYLSGSILFTVLILIIGFQNYGANISGFTVFFTELDLNGTLIVFGVSFLGICAGAFYFGFLTNVLRSKQEDEEEPGGTMV